MRMPVIAGNWKMNTSITEACDLARQIASTSNNIKDVEKIICPPYISLSSVSEIIRGTSIKLGAQNVYFEEKGAFTGEISTGMLQGICEYVIIGHSERRQLFHESDDIINKKIHRVLHSDLTPIFCVGERLEENESGRTHEIIKNQVESGLFNIAPTENIMIAYEPVWAIGTGKAATGKEANETATYIRELIHHLWGGEFSQNLQILYGGSVNSKNISEFIGQDDIDGALVGGASLMAQEFVSIIQQTSDIKSSK